MEKAVADIKSVTVAVDKEAETVTLTGSNKDAIQKAADALVAAQPRVRMLRVLMLLALSAMSGSAAARPTAPTIVQLAA